MRVINGNSISSISVTSADAGHPITNLLNESPKRKWTAANAGVTSATITTEVRGLTDSIGIVGVSADSMNILISDPNGLVWENVTWNFIDWRDSPDAVDVTYTIAPQLQGTFNAWVGFPQFDSIVDISIVLTKLPENPATISAGVLVIGASEGFNEPKFGLTEGFEDYSFTKMLSNGATYYKRRDIVRKFSGSIDVRRDDDFYRFMYGVAQTKGLMPLMWLLVDTLGSKWVIYGRLNSMPSGSHVYPNESEIGFDIIEVL